VTRRAANGRVPFLPFYSAITAIGFVSGIGPGLAALTVAECLMAYLWLLPMVVLLLFALGAGLGLALAVTARHLLLESRRTGRMISLVGASLDTTGLHRAQEAVQRSEKQLRTVTDALPVLVSLVDQNHIYRFNNAAYERWRGMSRSEITHRHVRSERPIAIAGPAPRGAARCTGASARTLSGAGKKAPSRQRGVNQREGCRQRTDDVTVQEVAVRW